MTGARLDDWLSRRGVVALFRLVHGAFFVAVAAYCFLSYSPFAYEQFIKPNVVPALTEFVMLSQWYFWVVLLVTVLTLMPHLRGGRGRTLSWAYVLIWIPVGAVVLFKPPLRTIGNSWFGFAVGLLALAPPVWVAIIDHQARPAVQLEPARLSRVFAACIGSALVAWASYAFAAPLRLRETPGIELTGAGVAIGVASSLAVDLFCFTAFFLALATAMAFAQRSRGRARVEYWSFVALLGTSAALALYLLVCASIAFTGRDAAVASIGLGLAFAAVWADVARLRAPDDRAADCLDSLTLFATPVAPARSRWRAAVVLLPLIAYGLIDAVSHLDWNFLLQKLTVLLVWLAAFSFVAALTSSWKIDRPVKAGRYLSAAVLLVFGLYRGVVAFEARDGDGASPQMTLDRYAAVDPAFRLVRDARTGRSAETVEYYAFLKSHTLAPLNKIPRREVDLVSPLTPASGMRPDIYLIIVDSLRRDYLEPYNARVSFTPEIERLARDSFVFDRAFTHYAGTALAVASIWAGGLVPHALEQPAFESRNTLLKLLDANNYARMMNLDHVVNGLVAPDEHLVQLDRGKGTMEFDVCATMTELEANVQRTDPSRPVFFYSLPQNVHIAVSSRRKVPAGESYPGFFAPVASSVRRIDGCIGGFVDFLKRTHRFDRSIVILTSDHGDSLGEEGRWGHAYFIVPEVMRIPLIVHVPPSLAAGKSVDLSAVTFSSDLPSSLYALLGYTPKALGDFMGRPAFGPPDADSAWRRRDAFLVASSYGAVYGMLRQNGTRLYAVDAVDGRDNAYDLSDDGVGRRVDVTRAMTADNRQLIREALIELARQNGYRPRS